MRQSVLTFPMVHTLRLSVLGVIMTKYSIIQKISKTETIAYIDQPLLTTLMRVRQIIDQAAHMSCASTCLTTSLRFSEKQRMTALQSSVKNGHLIDRFIPSEYLFKGFEWRRKSRLLVYFSLFASLTGAAYATLYLFHYEIPMISFILFFSSLVAVSAPLTFCLFKSFTLSSVQMLIGYYLAIFVITITVGGFESVTHFWFTSIPIFSLLLNDIWHALIWSVICIITGILIYSTSNFGMHNLMRPELMDAAKFEGWLGFIIFIPLLTSLFEFAKNRMLSEMEQSKQEVIEKTNDIRSILSSIPEGVFQIVLNNGELSIDDEYSHYLIKLFGKREYAGADPLDVIFQKTSLSPDQLSLIKSILLTALENEILQWEVNSHIIPNEFHLTSGPSKAFIEASWSVILDQNEIVRKVLVSLRDVTEIRKLHDESEKKSKESEMIIELSSIDSNKASDFLLIASDIHRDTMQLAETAQLTPDVVATIYRNVHTIKGLSRGYNFVSLINAAHDSEEFLSQYSVSSQDECKDQLILGIKRIDSTLEEYIRIYNNVLGRKISKETIEVNRESIIRIQKDLDLAAIDKSRCDEIISKIKHNISLLYCENLTRLLSDEFDMAKKSAAKIGKPEPEICVENDVFIVNDHYKTALRKAFVHILRNSIDHGIESPDERIKEGKSQAGTISISIKKNENNYVIYIKDDGKGLDLIRLRDTGIAKELIAEGLTYSDSEIANLIFEPGFSTSTKVTDISGRGVGMDAIKEFLRSCNCDIKLQLSEEITTERYLHFCLEIEMPSDSFSQI